jgi:hypothetical protein
VAGEFGLARIVGQHADALGLTVDEASTPATASGGDASAAVSEEAVWAQLRTCYDPEIPVNIVDLGLVYDCCIEQTAGAPANVQVKMTLTVRSARGQTCAGESAEQAGESPVCPVGCMGQ